MYLKGWDYIAVTVDYAHLYQADANTSSLQISAGEKPVQKIVQGVDELEGNKIASKGILLRKEKLISSSSAEMDEKVNKLRYVEVWRH